MNAAEILTLLDQDLAAGILAWCDLREQRANAVPNVHAAQALAEVYGGLVREHIAAEANPAHTLAAVRRVRKLVERHKPNALTDCLGCAGIHEWPCPEVDETADEARAYLGGAP
jgi:hypothetical protein